MKTIIIKKLSYLSLILIIVSASCRLTKENPFWGDGTERFEVQEIFSDERLPNIVVAKNGSVLAVWGWGNFRVRRSEDGGVTWGPEIFIREGLNSGGAIVDDGTFALRDSGTDKRRS